LLLASESLFAIVLAWIVTIPASALIAWVSFAIFNTAGLRG